MKFIKVHKLCLVNFKGIQSLTIDFNDDVTTISGRNGVGKSTVFDAFTWLLFGKDSHGRKQFDIKTLDASGIAIPKIPHEVSGILSIDGKEIELCRRYSEKWTKKRGQVEEEFSGHEEERLYNGVAQSVAEWSKLIDAICDEDVFKYITNPLFFTALKPDQQRTMLLRMAGDIDTETIKANADGVDLTDVIDKLNGTTLDTLKAELAAKKRRIKAEIETLPARIDERNRDIAELRSIDFDAIRKQADEINKEIDAVKAEMTNSDAKRKADETAQNAKTAEIAKAQQRLADIRNRITTAMFEKVAAADANKLQRESEIKRLETLDEQRRQRVDNLKKGAERLSAHRETLLEAFRVEASKQLTIDASNFICPTCKRPLEQGDVDAKREELTRNFNETKAANLQRIQNEGKQVRSQLDAANAEIEKLNAELDGSKESIDKIKLILSMLAVAARPTAEDIEKAINADDEYVALSAELKNLQQPSTIQGELFKDNEQSLAKIDELTKRLTELTAEINKADELTRNLERVEELEKQYRQGSQALADCEAQEFTAQAYGRALMSAVEKRINGLFKLTKWKLFDTQINGAIVETCEATYNGVPYGSLNSAARINIGLDIINAITAYDMIAAPIFIDNAESVNEIIKTQSQQIHLVVTTDENLTIK